MLIKYLFWHTAFLKKKKKMKTKCVTMKVRCLGHWVKAEQSQRGEVWRKSKKARRRQGGRLCIGWGLKRGAEAERSKHSVISTLTHFVIEYDNDFRARQTCLGASFPPLQPCSFFPCLTYFPLKKETRKKKKGKLNAHPAEYIKPAILFSFIPPFFLSFFKSRLFRHLRGVRSIFSWERFWKLEIRLFFLYLKK